MRELDCGEITRCVREMCLAACRTPDPNLPGLLEAAIEKESSPIAGEILGQLLDNIQVAGGTGLPLCQDTGMAVFFAEVGQDLHITGGDFEDALQEGVRQGYIEGCFRASVLTPLTRINTGDNTPAIIHTRIVPGDKLTLRLAPKGFGSENMSKVYMLTPSQGEEGVVTHIVETVKQAGGSSCPPVVLGVGIGSDFEGCALLAKQALLRPLGQPSPDPVLAALENRTLAAVNRLGIGPMGLGGNTTALACHILAAPTHIAGLPLAVNIQCHCVRHQSRVL
ncbi:MAG: fumarate hydratase [Christensenellales bacterium]|jgi:fumarate hydratase subunit alpha